MNSASGSGGFSAEFTVNLHAIVGDFESGSEHGAMLRAVFNQYWIRIVDVQQDFSRVAAFWILREQSVRTGKRNVSHFACRLFAPASLLQLAIAPERAIDQNKIARHGPLFPSRIDAGKGGRYENSFAGKLHVQRDDGVARMELLTQALADVVRILPADGDCVNRQARRLARLRNMCRREFGGYVQRKPLHWRCRAAQHPENRIFFVENAADGRSRMDPESLELAHM